MKVFFDYEIISFWSYEESSWKNVAIVSILFSNCIKIFPRTQHTYLSKKYEFKSDYCSTNDLVWRFQKMRASVREKKK